MDPRPRTLAPRAAILADDDAVYGDTLAALEGLDWGRLRPDEQDRVHDLTGRCGRLWDGSWDFSRLRRVEVDELARLARKASVLDCLAAA